MGATFYSQALREHDWQWMVAEAKANARYNADGHGLCFLGTFFDIMPSGKYWTFYACSNVTEAEADRDARYWAALEKAAEKHGGWIENGEGDPCDVFFGLSMEASV